MGFAGGSDGKEYTLMQETKVPFLGHPLEKGTATHLSILAWRIPWTEEPGWLQFMGLKELDRTEGLTHKHTVSTWFLLLKPKAMSLLSPSSFRKAFRVTQKAGMFLLTRPTSVAVVFLWDKAILDPCIVNPCIVNSISQDVYKGNRKRNKSGKMNFYSSIQHSFSIYHVSNKMNMTARLLFRGSLLGLPWQSNG